MTDDTTFPGIMYAWAKNRPDKVINHISPSMIGRCMRVHYFAIKHVPQTTPPSPGAQLNFKVGFLWEKVVGEALQNSSIPFIEQLHLLDRELNVEGTCDFVPRVNGEWEVWDSKTEGLMAANYRKREGKSFFNAHPEYVHQLNLYCILLRRAGFDVRRGRFGVIVKDNGLITESITNFEESSLQATLERVSQLNGYLDRGEVPPCECEGWMVNYCSFGDPSSITTNNKGKAVPTRCCSSELIKTGDNL